MKKNFFLAAWPLLAFSAFGQTPDTTFLSIRQEEGLLEKPRFIDQYDYLFGTKQPTRFLVKLNVAPAVQPLGKYALEEGSIFSNVLGDFDDISKAELGLEWKVAPALSLYAGGVVPTRGSKYYQGHYRGGGWRIEPRWYYEMPRRIRAGKSANNVSGNYIGLEYQAFMQSDRDKEPATLFERYQFQAVNLRYGLQRRLLRYGFVDLSIGAGYQQATYQSVYSSPRTDRGLFLETRVAAGLAFGAPRTAKSSVPFCDVLRCFQEDRHLWKIGLAKALQVNQADLASNPTVSYEQKIGSSPFSVETEVEAFLTTYRDFGDGLQLDKYGAGLNVQPRWYFLQTRRIAKGKSGNNLSGVFGGLMGGYQWTKWVVNTGDVEFNSHIFYVAPHLGIQQRLFRNGFIHYKFGLLYDLQDGLAEPSSFLSELQVGLAF